jgi:transcriptional regulator with XRE-family HTH domain
MEDSVNYRTLGDRIRQVRKESRLSQKVFGKLCGVSPLTLMRYESGSRGPDARFLVRVRENFNVNANWLLTGQGGVYLDQPAEGYGGSQPLDAAGMSALFQEFADFLKTRSSRTVEFDTAGQAAKSTDANSGILIVSPERSGCRKIREVMVKLSHEVLDASNAREAQRMMGFRRFSLIVLDNRLEKIERRKLLEYVRDKSSSAVLLFGQGDGQMADEIMPEERLEMTGKRSLEEREILAGAGRLLHASASGSKSR